MLGVETASINRPESGRVRIETEGLNGSFPQVSLAKRSPTFERKLAEEEREASDDEEEEQEGLGNVGEGAFLYDHVCQMIVPRSDLARY